MTPPTITQSTLVDTICQDIEQSLLAQDLKGIFNVLPDSDLLRKLCARRWTGRPGHDIQPLWHAFIAQYYLDLPSMNALIRRLEDDPYLAYICGFNLDDPLPTRRTVNRFFEMLGQRWVLVESCFNEAVTRLHMKLKDFGSVIAVDSTVIEAWSSPNRTPISDPDAHWAHRKDDQGKTIAIWGYKVHVATCAKYELPLGVIVTPGNVNDTTQLIPLLTKLNAEFDWFSPKTVIADAGYDSTSNYEFITSRFSAVPVIRMRKHGEKWASPDIADYEGTPHCLAGIPFIFWGYDKRKGLKYVCPEKVGKIACPIFGKCGTSVVWIRPANDYRRFCPVPRASARWKLIYAQRQSAEHIFSRLKEHRRLDDHCFRGIEKITVHSTLAALVVVASALAKIRAGRRYELRACVRAIP
ncbi:IS1182 family transposase ISDre5 [subsurface metagenome]